jgi:hypothetical protein
MVGFLCDPCTAIRHIHAYSRGFFRAENAEKRRETPSKKIGNQFYLCGLRERVPSGFWVAAVPRCALLWPVRPASGSAHPVNPVKASGSGISI